MATALETINTSIAKVQNVVGAVQSLRDLLPTPVQAGLDSIFNNPSTQTSINSLKGVNRFKSVIERRNGVARTNHFYVTIQNPRVLSGDKLQLEIPYLVESASLPGISLATSEVRRYGYGVIERKPYAPIFVDQNLTFLGDNQGAVHAYFTKWMKHIVNFDQFAAGSPTPYGARPFEVEFKDNYKTTVTIVAIDEKARKIIEIELQEAYPIFVGDVGMNWSDPDNFMRIPVTFTYFNWKRTDLYISALDQMVGANPGGALGQTLTALQKFQKVGTAIQTLAGIAKTPRSVAEAAKQIRTTRNVIGSLKGIF